MVRNHMMFLGLMILLGGRTAWSMTVDSSDRSLTNLTVSRDRKKDDTESTDVAIDKILVDITRRIFRSDDSHLMSLIKKGIVEAASAKTSSSIEAGAKKAQEYVTNVTAAYTQAIFRANTAEEARNILLRFQDNIQRIVDYAKNGDFTS